jgi:hypothetical protein
LEYWRLAFRQVVVAVIEHILVENVELPIDFILVPKTAIIVVLRLVYLSIEFVKGKLMLRCLFVTARY